MPTKTHNFVLMRSMDGFMRAMRKIKQADGYNTTPKVQVGHKPFDQVPAGEMPYLAVEMGDLAPDQETTGSIPNIRWVWPAFVWGYVATSGNRADLYEAGMALLADVFSAIWSDEKLTDGAGQGTVYFVNPGEITFDMERFASENKGYFLAEFQMVTDTQRSEEP